MQATNAFVGKPQKPTEKEICAALGSSAEVWTQLVHWFAEREGVAVQEWKSVSPKYGWSLRLKLKARTIVHMAPCRDCFQVAFILGDRAVKAALHSDLPKSLAQAIADAPRYAEGTGIRLVIRKADELGAVRKLAAIKLAN